jgi:hypothetical protein
MRPPRTILSHTPLLPCGKIRIAIAPAFAHNPPMLAHVLSAALSAAVRTCATKAEVNGMGAFPVEVEVNCGWGDTIIVILSCILLAHQKQAQDATMATY